MISGTKKLNKITLTYFYKVNNPDCQITRRPLYNCLDNYREEITIQEVNFENKKEICYAYRIYGVPTLLITRKGIVLNRDSGILDSHEINVLLDPIII